MSMKLRLRKNKQDQVQTMVQLTIYGNPYV